MPLSRQKGSDHGLHAFLRAAMGPEALRSPGPIELLAQLLGNPAGEHDLPFPAGGAVALGRGHGTLVHMYTNHPTVAELVASPGHRGP
jgi:hypothetical protein